MWFCLLFFLSCDKSIKSENPNNYVEPTTPLILISVDGFRWDYFDKVETPNFDRIINPNTDPRKNTINILISSLSIG